MTTFNSAISVIGCELPLQDKRRMASKEDCKLSCEVNFTYPIMGIDCVVPWQGSSWRNFRTNPKKSHEGGFIYMIVDNGYQLEVFRNSFQNVNLNIQTIGENSDPTKAMVDFTRTIFNYLEKKKSKA